MSKKAKERLSEVGSAPWNGGGCAKKKNKKKIQNKKVERILLGKNFLLVEGIQLSVEEPTEEEEMMQQQKMVIMKDQIRESDQKEDWTLKADGGFLSCWRQTVRKRGFTQDGKILCRHVLSGWRT